VTTESEDGAEKDGLEVLRSGEDGRMPDIPGVDWDKFDPTWRYNPGREALAPNFGKYKNLPEGTLKQIYAQYRQSMDNTKMTAGEFKTLLKRTNEADYKPLNVKYQVGNLEAERFEAMRKAGVQDSKIMATDHDLWHGTASKRSRQKDKQSKQTVNEELFDEIYDMLQTPESIYQEVTPTKQRQENIFHFVKDTRDGKKLKIIVHVKNVGNGQTAMRIRTLGHAEYVYTKRQYVKIW
jgi:hypothetical protein